MRTVDIINPQSSTSGNSGMPSFRNLVIFVIFIRILAMEEKPRIVADSVLPIPYNRLALLTHSRSRRCRMRHSVHVDEAKSCIVAMNLSTFQTKDEL